ncbi:MAG: hypothetical protein ACE37F_17900 [Nannocystaceae bacterium]|nr:hypothetical protein [bacterium]
MYLPRVCAVVLASAGLALGCDSSGTEGAGSTGSAASSDASTGTTTPSASTGATETTSASAPATTGSSGDASTGAPTTSGDTAEGSTGPDLPPDAAPPNSAELLPWLEAASYAGWPAESATHPSAGPHFTAVRTFVNDTLLTSLEAGSEDHPLGSTAVKELYGADEALGGWAVIVKVAPGSSADSWYWYESFEGTTYADETGNAGCGNCHGQGQDYVRTPVPLQ